jgi:hypothetical protein
MNGSNTEEGTAQMDEDGAARERDLNLDVMKHNAGSLKLAMDCYFFELIGTNR